MTSELRVSRISYAPVKGMRVLDLREAELGRAGIPGDRAFYLVDERRRMVNAKRFGALLTILPEHDPVAKTLRLRFPDGSVCEDEVETGRLEAVSFFGRQVQARPVAGAFSTAVSDFVGHELRLMARPESQAAVDRGAIAAVTLLGTSSVIRLEDIAAEIPVGASVGTVAGNPAWPASTAPTPDAPTGDAATPAAPPPAAAAIDHRRFRMSIKFDGAAPYAEDDWIGRKLRAGEATLRVNGHVGRCAVTTRDPDTGTRDLPVLDLLKASRGNVISEEPLPFGVYAMVREPGRIRIGDPIAPL